MAMAGLLALCGCDVHPPASAPSLSTGAPAQATQPPQARPPTGTAGAPGPFQDPAVAQAPGADARVILPLLSVRNGRFVDPQGQPVLLRGCNLGTWLLLEMWMLDLFPNHDQHDWETLLTRRFGEVRKDELMDAHRLNFIGPRDFGIIRSFGFNCVRVPFEYRLLEDDRQPMTLKPDAFRWLDRAVALAEEAGIYVILDLHGAPGRQSSDHTTGQAGQNRLWSDPACQERTVWLWKEIAARYRDSTTVVAYDLLNEPFGDGTTADHLPALSDLMGRLYREVRDIDDRHIILIAGARQGLDHYGNPADRGWTNMAFTEHYYPGLFGDVATMETHARFIGQQIPVRAARLAAQQVPLLVGEFNVVFQNLQAPALMRRYYDEYAARGWAATMWSYKLLHRRGGAGGDFWGMVANRDPLPQIDLATSTFAELQAFFAWLGTSPLAVNEALRHQLTTDRPDPVPLTAYRMMRDAPAREPVPGWQADDIGGSRTGGQRRLAGQSIEVYGGGSDIWRQRDQFRLVWQEAQGDLRLTARLDRLDDTSAHAKAGLMLRGSRDPGAPHVLIHAFPDGRILLGWRNRAGAFMEERELARAKLPLHLSLERQNGLLQVGYSQDGRTWKKEPLPDLNGLPDQCLAGLAVLAHAENEALTTAAFSDISLQR